MIAAQYMTNFAISPDDYLLLCTINEKIDRGDEARLRARKRGFDLRTTGAKSLSEITERAKGCATKIKDAASRRLGLAAAPAAPMPPPRRPKDDFFDNSDDDQDPEDEQEEKKKRPGKFDPPFGTGVTPGYAASYRIMRSARAY